METPRISLGRMQNPVRGFLHGGAALLAATVGLPLLVIRANSGVTLAGGLVFGIALVALYLTSALYHAIPWGEVWKKRMRRLDHSMIFVLIIGTFTPVALVGLEGKVRIIALVAGWTIAIVGIVHQMLTKTPGMALSIALKATLGWLAVLVIYPLAQSLGMFPVVLLGIGGAVYTVGMVFLVTERPRLWPRVFSYHEVFHILTIVASSFHFVVAYRYLMTAA
ncbi:MAG: hemolysin III family protein [Acidobacteria bacterium]|nr:hemolysin III family protein [Acidobacteriota bacterium]